MRDDRVRAVIFKAEELLDGHGRVIVRASGTEPLIRILTESDDAAVCERTAAMIEEAIVKAEDD